MTENYPMLRDLLLGLSTPGGDLHFLKANCSPLREELRGLLSRVEALERPWSLEVEPETIEIIATELAPFLAPGADAYDAAQAVRNRLADVLA